MARQLSKTLTSNLLPISLSSRVFSSKARLIEVDLDSSSSESGEIEVLGLKKLEDAIHSIFVRRLAPDWLPFRPGSSYWVPPKRPTDNIVELVEKLTNPLTEEESLSLSSARGWPSSSFFLGGNFVVVVVVNLIDYFDVLRDVIVMNRLEMGFFD